MFKGGDERSSDHSALSYNLSIPQGTTDTLQRLLRGTLKFLTSLLRGEGTAHGASHATGEAVYVILRGSVARLEVIHRTVTQIAQRAVKARTALHPQREDTLCDPHPTVADACTAGAGGNSVLRLECQPAAVGAPRNIEQHLIAMEELLVETAAATAALMVKTKPTAPFD